MKKSGAFFLTLFGLVFFGVGAGFGAATLRTLLRAQAMRAWERVPATVQSCELRVSRDSDGDATCRVEATYTYAYGGRRYTSDRVTHSRASDNIGDFHRRVHAELKRARDGVEATHCWVNPQNPSESILYPRPRPELLAFMQLFVLAFGGAGLGIMLAGLSLLLRRPEREPAAGQGQIRMRGAASHQVAGALALVWNGYVGLSLWKAFVVFAPEPLPWYLWLLAATGVAPAAVAGYLVGRFRKFGVSVFEMSPLPGVLGGPVTGNIRIPAHFEVDDGFELTLRCIHQYTTRSGKNSSTHKDVLWEESRHLASGYTFGEETLLPVRFSAPYDKPATSAAGGSNGDYWQLTAAAAAPGIDYKAVFDVPVRRTAQSVAPSEAPPPAAGAPEAAPEPAPSGQRLEALVRRAGLRLEPRPDGGFELVFPPSLARSAVLGLLLFVAFWSAVCAFLWLVPRRPPLLFAVVFSALDLLLVLMLGDALLVTRGVVVDRARRECVVWRRLPGLRRGERRVAFDEVVDVRCERGAQSGETVYYRVSLVGRDGRPVAVGSGLRMWNDAEAVARLLEAATRPAFVL